ncbi:MAG: ABC transporter ATP-binding protein [Candidatus Eremiobacteraeota bacterium]|nr:ABC transporter ATP-binding protein [Candidatus Eremiobacteraeota bacterium]
MLHVDIAARAGSLPVSCSFAVPSANTIALVGASGAGKTTVLRAIAGLIRPQLGRIVHHERVWFDADRRIFVPAQHRDCAMVFADHALFAHMNVIENVAFGPHALGQRREAAKKAQHALELVGVAELGSRRASSLSSGEAQRVAIARALAVQPRVLLLDEPLSAIDVERRSPIRLALQRVIAQHSMCAVLVTHDPVEAMLFSETLVVMEGGAVVQRGSATELRERPRTSYVAAFAGVNLYRGSARPLADGVSAVEVAGTTMTIVGSATGPISLVVDPESVVLSQAPTATSARNLLHGSVASVVPDGASLRVSIASVPPITARITKTAADELGIVPGANVYATFKASEVRVH